VIEDLHHLSGKSAHRELRGALHEQHHVIAFDFVVDKLVDRHGIPHLPTPAAPKRLGYM
jgi:hypothetical protein